MTMHHPVVEEDLAAILGEGVDWGAFAGKTVLVTGAGGFLPAWFVHALLRRNDRSGGAPARVVALVRSVERAQSRLGRHAGRADFSLVEQDVCLPVDLREKVDFVIHAASQASPKYYGSDPSGTISANVLGTRNLLELAREHGSEGFLFLSGGEVYGQLRDDQIPTRESECGAVEPMAVRSCYAEGKRAGETMCAAWAHQFGVPAKVARLYHTYGPGMALDDGRVFADFVADVLAGRDLSMNSDGLAVRAFCYVADAVAGMFRVLLEGKAGEAYNVGNDAGQIPIGELAELIARLFPEKGLKVVRKGGAGQPGYIPSPFSRACPDISKARALGWNPATTLETGFARTVRSFLP
jgi:nucleoside-diphosphate-sugar epimerase